MDSFPSNSRRVTRTPEEQPKEVTRVTTGEVIRRKQPLGRRFSQSLIGGDAQSAWGYIFGEVLIPAARDMIADAVTGGVERMVFGDSGHRGGRRPSRSGYTPYNRYSGSSGRNDRGRDDRRDISRHARATHKFDEIIIDSRHEAQEVLNNLEEMIHRYEFVSVSTLYELVGISSNFAERKYGWTDLRDARIVRVRNGYLLDLPRPEPFD